MNIKKCESNKTNQLIPRENTSTITLSLKEIECLIDKSAEKGAKKILDKIGLSDENAGYDIRDLRSLLHMIDNAKRTAWQTIVRTITLGFIMVLITGIIFKLGAFGGNTSNLIGGSIK